MKISVTNPKTPFGLNVRVLDSSSYDTLTDSTPYLFRSSPHDLGVLPKEFNTVVGGTVAWNQLSIKDREQTTIFTITNFVISNGIARIWGTWNGNNGSEFRQTMSNKAIPDNHIVFLDTGLRNDILTCRLQGMMTGKGTNYTILKTSGGSCLADMVIGAKVDKGTSIDISFTPQIIDLTLLFGSTIADYIYTLEQSHAGDGVAFFRSLFPKSYYAYDAGSLQSVNTSMHKMVGFNIFDKSTVLNGYYINDANGEVRPSEGSACSDYMRVVPNLTYYIQSEQTLGAWGAWYDADKQYISGITGYTASGGTGKIKTAPSNACYMRLTTVRNGSGNNDTFCVHIRWDNSRDTDYEPYKAYEYPLDSSLTLRGLAKLDANNKLYYDGDTYEANGTVTRKYQQRAYQSGDESLADAITDGTNTVVKLTTPTTETADPFQNPQIVDKWGTEEYVDYGVSQSTRDVGIPVGHNTTYRFLAE